jgi:hypothetical protein
MQFTGIAGVDFTLVRDTMYKYSKQAQKRFFENPALAFMFAWFATSAEGLNFIQSKYSEKGQEYLDRIYQEIETLKTQALLALSSHASSAMHEKSTTMSPVLNRYIEVVAVGCTK